MNHLEEEDAAGNKHYAVETEIERHKVLDRKQEEILKSKVVNHATFLYLQEELDGVNKR